MTTMPPAPGLGAPLTPEQEQIIRDTLPVVGEHIDQIAPLFYSKMFAQHPELLRDTFNRGNQAQGAQQKALAASVATYATLLVTPDAPEPKDLLGRIGHKHVSLGICEDQYGIVHENLMAAIGEVLGDAVTPPVADAWSAVYWNMAKVLIDFETELYEAAGVEPGDVFRTARVVDRVEESTSVTTFTLSGLDGDLPGFLPGQYISVGAPMADGARQLRQYSLTEAPGTGRWRFSVKRVEASDASPEGEVSTWLHQNLKVGDQLEVTLPYGDLTLDTGSDAPVVLVSAGIGATPMLGMLHHLADRQPERRARVIHADIDGADAALVDEMAGLVGRIAGGSTLSLWFEQGADAKQGLVGERVSVSTGRVELTAEDVAGDAEIYLCGPAGFLQAVTERLSALGVGESRVHVELFTPNDWLLPSA
ncbi:FAD-binding oxidoreductase [Propioniferax innocua]|uniref:nitric oxide dioxygenase n=1 Tax=Propioniferax innocua TaxID=1753 RepID=A0A542ZRN5_9ACTN|nr:FAD-binding oxidoreductase [Propioniferax innocua]TQL62909.1 nitric oxide dioxygenase [Propioniferax innocua]